MDFMALLNMGKELVAGNYITVALGIAPFILPNTVVRGFGFGVGKVLSTVLRQRAGKKQGEAVESFFQGSISALTDGLNEGMDSDDAE